ncbi:MAG: hypothetical protein FJ381_05880 [Verrucomicrobia bacterium]|nr:hypothetical protein [Verrucomicrobiota bacterium]
MPLPRLHTTAALLALLSPAALRAETYSVTTFAGTSNVAGGVDGTPGTFNSPYGLAVDAARNLVVADTINNTVRRITPGRVVSTLAGSFGQSGFLDATGAAARFNFPVGVAADGAGNVFVADARTFAIRRVSAAGVVATFAGAGLQAGTADGPAASARFLLPYGVAVDAAGNAYVAEGGSHVIRRISAAGVVTTLAGAAGASGFADGTGAAARFNVPWGIAVDAAGTVYVADSENHLIRRISAAGVVSTVAGQKGVTGYADGASTVARFQQPRGLAVDAGGNLFVADYGNHTVRRISAAGAVETIAGSPGLIGDDNSVGASARFYYPAAVAVDGNAVYVADSGNNLVRRAVPVSAAALPVISIHPVEQQVATGQSVTFRVVASGGGLTYVWLRNGFAIPGATAAAFTLVAPTVADEASYRVRVSGPGGAVDSEPAALTVWPVGTDGVAITARPLGQSVAVGEAASFAVTATGSGLTYQWLRNGAALAGATRPTYTIAAVQTADAGVYGVRVSADAVSETAFAKLVVGGVSGGAVTLVTEPLGRSVAVGQAVIFSVQAGGAGPFIYQWFKDGAALAGATAATLSLPAVQVSDAGSYVVRVSAGAAFIVSSGAVLTVQGPAGPAARLANLSVRTNLEAAATLIVGVAVAEGPREVLFRAVGPALAAFGVPGVMANPRIEIYNGAGVRVQENEDWQAGLAPVFSAVGAFALPAGSRDAALVAPLTPGGFTAQVPGAVGGVVLVEAYETGPAGAARLINVSARNRVGTGDDVLIAGFTLAGSGAKPLLIRAVGPGLAAFAVPGTLADPKLEIYNGAGVKVAENDTWDPALAAIFGSVGAFLLPAASRDAALRTELPPGSYTALVKGADGGTGEALVEVYELR